MRVLVRVCVCRNWVGYGLYFIRLSRTTARRAAVLCVYIVSRGGSCLRGTDKNIAAAGRGYNCGERTVRFTVIIIIIIVTVLYIFVVTI